MYEEFCDSGQPYGSPRRYEYCPFCDSNSNSLVVWHHDKGWSIYCHRCHFKRFVPSGGVAPASVVLGRVKSVLSLKDYEARSIYLPPDFVPEIPLHARKWLYSNGLTDEDITKYRIGYSPAYNRVILPAYFEGRLVLWTARRLSENTDEPKYITAHTNKREGRFYAMIDGSDSVVLVEDILSAIAVRRAGFSCIALMGTYLTREMLGYLHKKGIKKVFVWLDPDKLTEMVRYVRVLNSLGFRAYTCLSGTKDPKRYSVSEVHQHLQSGGFINDCCSSYQEVQEA